MHSRKLFWALAVGSLLGGCSNGGTTSAHTKFDNGSSPTVDKRGLNYGLAERCAHDARHWFSHFYGNGMQSGPDGFISTSYVNHFDSKTDQCLALVSSSGTTKDKASGRLLASQSASLTNVNENRDIGVFFQFIGSGKPMQCEMADKPCHSRDEWDLWATRFMRE